MEILVIIILILLNGILSLAEMSLVSARKFKLENEVKKGNERAKIALEVSQNPTKLLSTVQIGITVIGILLGIFSGANITDDFEKLLDARKVLVEPLSYWQVLNQMTVVSDVLQRDRSMLNDWLFLKQTRTWF